MRRQSVSSEDDSARYQLESISPNTVPGAGRVLRQAFPDNVIADLGEGFVKELLASYLSVKGGCGYVCVRDDEVVGFVVGTDDAAHHRRVFLRTRWPFLTYHVLVRLLVSPRLLFRLVQYLRTYLSLPNLLGSFVRKQGEANAIPPASLVMLAVLPDHRRRGIADRLMRAFLAEMERRGVDRVKLAVATYNEVAVAFYLSRDWQIAGCYPAPEGSTAYRLVYQINGSMAFGR